MTGATKPRAWGDTFSRSPDLCSSTIGWTRGLVRRWHGTSARMVQPGLDQHYVVLHLGGAKRVRRRSQHVAKTVDVQCGSLSVVPAKSEWHWSTEGPIGFAHIYLPPRGVDRVVQEDFDRNPAPIELSDSIGHVSGSLNRLYQAILDEIETPSLACSLMMDTLYHAFLVRLLSECSNLSSSVPAMPHRLAPHRLRRVIEYIDANLADDIALQDLAAVAGTSRFHFSRAFREATGVPPYRFVVSKRVEAARSLLIESELSLSEVAARTGFRSAAQLGAMFTQSLGETPTRFRRNH